MTNVEWQKFFLWGLGVIPFRMENYSKMPQLTDKTACGHKTHWRLSPWCHSLLWVSWFSSSQPCGWLMGKIEAKQNFIHKLLPQIFSEPSRLSGCPKQCVIRWFSFTSVHDNLGIQVVLFANRH